MSLRSALPALAAALLFGASTPLAKLLVGDVPPLLLAGLLYLGSGLGLGALLVARRAGAAAGGPGAPWLGIPRPDWPWLLGATVCGGMFGPALLMRGLSSTPGAAASLLLNVEGVLTALIAWWVFKENANRQVMVGMAAIVCGGVLLSWEPGAAAVSTGALFVLGACLCWAVDNNLTRQVSSNDAMLVAAVKGLFAGACNTALALAGGAGWPTLPTVGASLLVGFFGYGLSLSLFVLALRALGTARTGAYFSVAPLFGVLISLVLWPELPGPTFWPATVLMVLGVGLHLRETHLHEHSHQPLEHSHHHRHDAHHLHAHDPAFHGDAAHVHTHRHEAQTHSHAHYPDIHHRHPHPRPHQAGAAAVAEAGAMAVDQRKGPTLPPGPKQPSTREARG